MSGALSPRSLALQGFEVVVAAAAPAGSAPIVATRDDMSVIKPHTLTDAMLTSSTVIDIAPAAYLPGTTYLSGTQVSVAGAAGLITAYKSLQAANAGHTPATSPLWWAVINTLYQQYSSGATYAKGNRVQDNAAHLIYESVSLTANTGNALTDATKWLVVSATGRWAAFDDVIGTKSVGASPMKIVLRPNLSTTGFGLYECSAGTAQLTVRDAPGGNVIYDKTVVLDGTVIDSVYDWFFAQPGDDNITDLALTDLPGQYFGAEITLVLTAGAAAGPMVSIGVAKPGVATVIGGARFGAQVGIVDYSKKDTDGFGFTSFVEGDFSKKGSLQVLVAPARFNKVYRTLASVRAKPCFYIGSPQPNLQPLLFYGRYLDFYIAIPGAKEYVCALELQGLGQ